MKRKTNNSMIQNYRRGSNLCPVAFSAALPPCFLLHPGSRDAENVDFTDGARRLKTFRDQNSFVFVGALF